MPAHDVSVVSTSDVHRPPLLVLLASALLGPTAWQPVAEALRAMGREVIVVPPEGALVPATADEASDLYDRFVPTDRALILVPHSNAGNFVPALIGSRKVAAVVFVDSVIPVAFGVQNLAPPEFLAEIEQLADEDGMLPIWTSWFPEDDVAPLFPNPSVRSGVESRQPTLSVRFLRSSLLIQPGWDTVPAGYLAFGNTYADEQDRAGIYGWKVVRLDGRHLHMVVDPQRVAVEILALARPQEPKDP